MRLCTCFILGAILAFPLNTRAEDEPTPKQYLTSANNLKQIALAFHNYESVYLQFPTNVLSKDGKPLLSWRVLILPYMEQEKLFAEFKMDEPWDSEHNKKLIEKMPQIYKPVRGTAKAGETYYQIYSGPGTLLHGKPKRIADIVDGTSNTFLAVEAAKPVIWTKPDDIVFDPKMPNQVGGLFPKDFQVVFADGAVRRLPKNLDDEAFKALIGYNDGIVVDLEKAIKKARDK